MDGGRSYRPRFILCIFILLAVFIAGCKSHRTVTLALLGDINLGRGVNPSVDSFSILSADLSTADLALANLESPLTPEPSAPDSDYNLCAPAGRASLLADWELDLLSIANNHVLDCAPGGLLETRSALAEAGLGWVDMEPVYREINGLKLAFLAFDDVSSPLDTEAAAQTIRAARATGALVIVSIHWGVEYQGGASDRQKSLAQSFADAGAALIWGHHPHVLQPAGWIETTKAKTLVLYSLGNALFDQYGLDDTRRSALVLVTLDKGGVMGVRVVPFVIDVANSRLILPDAETAEKISNRLHIK